MDFELTARQRDLGERTRDYAERVVRLAAARLEQLSRAEDFPFDLMQEGTTLGLKAPLPPELGGIRADMITQCWSRRNWASGRAAAVQQAGRDSRHQRS
jgi:hypothetical protein